LSFQRVNYVCRGCPFCIFGAYAPELYVFLLSRDVPHKTPICGKNCSIARVADKNFLSKILALAFLLNELKAVAGEVKMSSMVERCRRTDLFCGEILFYNNLDELDWAEKDPIRW